MAQKDRTSSNVKALDNTLAMYRCTCLLVGNRRIHSTENWTTMNFIRSRKEAKGRHSGPQRGPLGLYCDRVS